MELYAQSYIGEVEVNIGMSHVDVYTGGLHSIT